MESLTPDLLATIACHITSAKALHAYLSACRATRQLRHQVPQVQLCVLLHRQHWDKLAQSCIQNIALVEELARLLACHPHLQRRSYTGAFGTDTLLNAACSVGCLPLVQLLVADVMATKAAGCKHPFNNKAGTALRHQALSQACQSGSVEVVECLLAAGVEVDPPGGCEEPALVMASNVFLGEESDEESDEEGDEESDEVPDLPSTDVASRDDPSPELVELLLAAGAGANVVDQDRRTPLIAAAMSGRLAVVERLLAVPGIELNRFGGTAAVKHDPDEYVGGRGPGRAMVMGGVQRTRSLKLTALQWACRKGHADVALLLLSTPGAQMTATGGSATHPLYLACESGLVPVVTWLLQQHHVSATLRLANDVQWALPLHYACKGGSMEVVQLLLAHGADVRCMDHQGRTPLHWACQAGRVEVVQLLLGMKEVKVDAKAGNDCTPLWEAAGSLGRGLAVAQALLAAGARVAAAKTKTNCTALHRACRRGNADLVQLLLSDPEVHVNAVDRSHGSPKGTALHDACRGGDTRVVQLLLAAPRIDVNARDALMSTSTPLHLAVEFPEVVQLLLGVQGIDIHAPDSSACSPLLVAIEKGHQDSAEALLAQPGVKLCCDTRWGRKQLLHAACEYGRVGVVCQLLLHPKVDPAARDGQGRTPLHLVCKGSNSPGKWITAQTIRELLDALLACPRVDVNAQDMEGKTPIDLALATENCAAVQKLVASGRLDCSSLDVDGGTAAHMACRTGKLRLLQALLAADPDQIHVRNALGQTPLHVACLSGHVSAVGLLLQQPGVDSSAADSAGRTVLHLAAQQGRAEVVKLLLAAGGGAGGTGGGVDVNAVDREGKAALELACAAKHARRRTTEVDFCGVVNALLEAPEVVMGLRVRVALSAWVKTLY